MFVCVLKLVSGVRRDRVTVTGTVTATGLAAGTGGATVTAATKGSSAWTALRAISVWRRTTRSPCVQVQTQGESCFV